MVSKTNPARKQPRRRPTMKDVAALAGVSTMTVSNAINGRSKEISETRRRAVQEAIDALGYHVQAGARGLRSAQQYSMCVVIVDESQAFLSDVFISQVIAGLSNRLNGAGYALSLQGCQPQKLSEALALRSHAYDGLFLVASGSDRHRRAVLGQLLDYGYPVIVFQETLSIKDEDCCVVRQADGCGGEALAAHLAHRGCRSFLFVEPSVQWPAITARLKGFRAGLARIPGTSLTELRASGEEFESSQSALRAYLEDNPRPDAVVAANDRMALALLKLLQASGISVPDEIKVTGFNGFESSLYATPALTTIVSPAYQLGEVAGGEMLHRLAEDKFSAPVIQLPVELRIGGTS